MLVQHFNNLLRDPSNMDDSFCHLFTLTNGASVGAKYDKGHFQKWERPSAFILEGQMATSDKAQDRKKYKKELWRDFSDKSSILLRFCVNLTD